jgi:hypothetical protein
MNPIIPSVKVLNGVGTPRIELISGIEYTSVGALTHGDYSVVEALGSTVNIVSSTGSPTVLTFAGAHGRVVGDFILISGHTSTPDINGVHMVIAMTDSGTHTITIDAVLTVGGGATGTIQRSPAFITRGLSIDTRLSGVTSLGEDTWARIDEITSETELSHTGWSNGVPTGTVTINGYIIDLPRCNRMLMKFQPQSIVKNLWRYRKKETFEGYWLTVTCDYSSYISGSTLQSLKKILNRLITDSMILTPRLDKPQFNYNVIMPTGFDMELQGTEGHKGIQFVFESTELVSFPTGGGYGFGYGKNYGHQL